MNNCKTENCGREIHSHGLCNKCASKKYYKENKTLIESRRKARGYSKEKKYEKTFNGYLVRTYRNMKSRVSGILKKKAHLYEGLELLGKEEFYSWAKTNKQFVELHSAWVSSGYDRKLSPSIDRINGRLGYTVENMRWVTHSENSRLGALSRHLATSKE